MRKLWKTRADVLMMMVGAVLLAVSAMITPFHKKEKGSTALTLSDASYFVFVIDAGHGGRDGGKVSVDNVTYEKDINLAIAYK